MTREKPEMTKCESEMTKGKYCHSEERIPLTMSFRTERSEREESSSRIRFLAYARNDKGRESRNDRDEMTVYKEYIKYFAPSP